MAKEPAKKEEVKKKVVSPLFNMRRTWAQLNAENYDFRISTKSLILDIFMDGGFRPGISRFAAPEEHGKSALALAWADSFLTYWWSQGKKAKVIYFDAECRLLPPKIKASKIHLNRYFRMNGDENDTFEHYQWNRYEDIAEYLYTQARDNANPEGYRIFFVLDSLDSLITKNGEEKSFDETEKIAAAQSISNVLIKKISPFIESNAGHCLYVTSQIRANVNMSNPNSPTTRVSGGHAIKHGQSLYGEIQEKKYSLIFENDDPKGKVIGHYMIIKFLKTFNEKSNRTIRVPIKYGKGVWTEREIVELAISYEIIKKKASWFNLDDGEADAYEKELPDFILNKEVNEKLIEKSYGQNLTEKQKSKLKEEISKETEKKPFKIEKVWQGMPAVYEYFESNPNLVDFLYDRFKRTLMVSGEEIKEEDSTEDKV